MATVKEKILAYLKKHPGASSSAIINACKSKVLTGRQQVSKLLGQMTHDKVLIRGGKESGRGKGFHYDIAGHSSSTTQSFSVEVADNSEIAKAWNAKTWNDLSKAYSAPDQIGHDFEVWWNEKGLFNATAFVYENKLVSGSHDRVAVRVIVDVLKAEYKRSFSAAAMKEILK